MKRSFDRIDRYKRLAESGTLTLRRDSWRWLFAQAEQGIAARGKVLVDPEGLSDCVICALEAPPLRQRRYRGQEPTR